jgi:hypothetical protein
LPNFTLAPSSTACFSCNILNCISCSDTTQCQTCAAGFSPNSNGTSCDTCQVGNCAVCLGPSEC